MAMFRAAAVVALLVVLGMALDVQAQAQPEPVCPSPTKYVQCQAALTKPDTMPTAACCNSVQTTLQAADGSGPFCLCKAMTSDIAQRLNVQKALAILLPSKCEQVIGLKYAKNYDCDGSIVP